MPVIVDNNFTNDSHSMRADRLNAIQSNYGLILKIYILIFK